MNVCLIFFMCVVCVRDFSMLCVCDLMRVCVRVSKRSTGFGGGLEAEAHSTDKMERRSWW